MILPLNNAADHQANALALYVHWPFCQAKCPYCDFNSHVRPKIDHHAYQKALLRELADTSRQIVGRPLHSIFFGGGTPSLMAPETVAAIIASAETHFGFEAGIEITLEANPTSIEAAKLRDFAQAGINRLSLGVQSFDDRALKFLGRKHSARDAKKAIELVQTHFRRWSFDLIYARPGQSAASWLSELSAALVFEPTHLSLYQLTIEPTTAFFRAERAGRFAMPSDDHQASLYEQTGARLADHGLNRYEISNYAKTGEECRHNLVYWRYGDYLGVGPGAHGRVRKPVPGGGAMTEKWATSTERVPERWRQAAEHTQSMAWERVSLREQIIETLLMGLRLETGIPWSRLNQLEAARQKQAPGQPPVINPHELACLTQDDLIAADAHYLRATPTGLLNLDGLLGKLIS